MSKFRKTAEVEASQWFKIGDHPAVIPVPYDHPTNLHAIKSSDWGWCPTLEGGHLVEPGDWILTGVHGEHWPCKPDIFAATYEAVGGDERPQEQAHDARDLVEGVSELSAQAQGRGEKTVALWAGESALQPDAADREAVHVSDVPAQAEVALGDERQRATETDRPRQITCAKCGGTRMGTFTPLTIKDREANRELPAGATLYSYPCLDCGAFLWLDPANWPRELDLQKQLTAERDTHIETLKRLAQYASENERLKQSASDTERPTTGSTAKAVTSGGPKRSAKELARDLRTRADFLFIDPSHWENYATGEMMREAADLLALFHESPQHATDSDFDVILGIASKLEATFDPGGSLPDDCDEWAEQHMNIIGELRGFAECALMASDEDEAGS